MKTELEVRKEIQAILDEEFTGYVDQLHGKLCRIQKILLDFEFPDESHLDKLKRCGLEDMP